MFTDFAESREEYRAWLDAITHTHERNVFVRVLDLEHRRKAFIDHVLDGQVTIDVSRQIPRLANIKLLDPSRSLGWEPDSPSSLPLHMRRMVQVIDERAVPGFGWVRCPVFCGPVAEMDRSGAEVDLVAEGKDRLALGSFGQARTWAKNRKVVEVIREMLILAGEAPSRIHLPDLNARLPKEVNVDRVDKPLVEVHKLVRSVDCVSFYDARGHFRMRRQPTQPTLTLDEDWLLGPLRIDRPRLAFKNRWILLGKKQGGDRPRISADVWIPKPNAFSAWSIGRNNKPRFEIWQEERLQVETRAKALEIVERKRDEKIRFVADVSGDFLPFPHVEEWDFLKAKDPQTGPAVMRVREATIPLVGGAQTIGSIERVSRVKRKFHPATHGGL